MFTAGSVNTPQCQCWIIHSADSK